MIWNPSSYIPPCGHCNSWLWSRSIQVSCRPLCKRWAGELVQLYVHDSRPSLAQTSFLFLQIPFLRSIRTSAVTRVICKKSTKDAISTRRTISTTDCRRPSWLKHAPCYVWVLYPGGEQTLQSREGTLMRLYRYISGLDGFSTCFLSSSSFSGQYPMSS